MPVKTGSLGMKQTKTTKTGKLSEVVESLFTGGIKDKSQFLTKMAEIKYDIMIKLLNDHPDVEYILCYAREQGFKYSPENCIMKLHTREGEKIFASNRDLLGSLNTPYIYMERNGGDTVVRDNLDCIINVKKEVIDD